MVPPERPKPKRTEETIEFVRKEEWERTRQEKQQLERDNQRLQGQIERLRQRVRELEQQLAAAHRAEHRSAAPFSRRPPKANPQRNGRKAGVLYGRHYRRTRPEQIHEQYRAPVPERCDCGGAVRVDQTKAQYQEEIVRRKIVRQFQVEIGHCVGCGKRWQGRHRLQTSDALDAAEVQWGAEALTLAAHLNKQMGLSYGKAAEVLRVGYGLEASRGGLCRAIARMGRKLAPTYDRLLVAVQQSRVAWLDETGWRIAAVLQWLWVALTAQITVYAILPGRGYAQAVRLLGENYGGCLHHDGWRPYYRFQNASHQSCLGHPIRRCRDLMEILSPGAARFPRAVQGLFQKLLEVRDRYQRQEISQHGRQTAAGRIRAQLDRLLENHYRHPANRRLAKHLDHEFPHLFTFLDYPGVEATNNRAERALRPAVKARYGRGGNRTAAGARTQEILASVLQTCRQQGKDSFLLLLELLRSPHVFPLDLLPEAPPPPQPPLHSRLPRAPTNPTAP
jgi:transposase